MKTKKEKDKSISEEDRISMIEITRCGIKKVKLKHEAESLRRILYKYKDGYCTSLDLENDLKYISTYVF